MERGKLNPSTRLTGLSSVNSARDTGGAPPLPSHSRRPPQSPVVQFPFWPELSKLQPVRAQKRPDHPVGPTKLADWPGFSSSPPFMSGGFPAPVRIPGHMKKEPVRKARTEAKNKGHDAAMIMDEMKLRKLSKRVPCRGPTGRWRAMMTMASDGGSGLMVNDCGVAPGRPSPSPASQTPIAIAHRLSLSPMSVVSLPSPTARRHSPLSRGHLSIASRHRPSVRGELVTAHGLTVIASRMCWTWTVGPLHAEEEGEHGNELDDKSDFLCFRLDSVYLQHAACSMQPVKATT
ncbi:alpha/beta-Hydrolases superfamily protein [Striga asiatica]|uniref:Alpha/beta-Hydrolases superfamily protein n=1 Tax=Striga asiatica TaxID=4170 RepID=A0A5A7Q4Q4_STRAF|nr:alpha/beta-Hydrolases superfamily protein [Striga asiatica]